MAKRGTLDHPKTKRLARALGAKPWAALGLLEAFWHWVGRYRPSGLLSHEDILDCSDTIGFDDDLACVLQSAGWLDAVGENYYVHDWHDHADDSVKKVLAKRNERFANGSDVRLGTKSTESKPIRERFANDSRPIHDKPKPKPKPNPKPEILETTSLVGVDAENRSPVLEIVVTEPTPDEHWQEFLSAYPKRLGDLGKAKGREKFLKLLRDRVEPERIISGANRYREFLISTGKIGTEYVKQIPTFLNSRAWEEEFEADVGLPAKPQAIDHLARIQHERELREARLACPN